MGSKMLYILYRRVTLGGFNQNQTKNILEGL